MRQLQCVIKITKCEGTYILAVWFLKQMLSQASVYKFIFIVAIIVHVHGLNYIELHFIVNNPQANEVQFALISCSLSRLTQYPFLILWFEGLTLLM